MRWLGSLSLCLVLATPHVASAQSCSTATTTRNGVTVKETTWTSASGGYTITVTTDAVDGRVIESTETNNVTGDRTESEFPMDYGLPPSVVPDPLYHAKFDDQRAFELWEPSHESTEQDSHTDEIKNNASMVKQECGV